MPGKYDANVDLTTRRGARLQAARLREYWHERGYPEVKTWVACFADKAWQDGVGFAVRSNIGKVLAERGDGVPIRPLRAANDNQPLPLCPGLTAGRIRTL